LATILLPAPSFLECGSLLPLFRAGACHRVNLRRQAALQKAAASRRTPKKTPEVIYKPDPNWPAAHGRGVPDYGTAMVMSVAVDATGQVIVVQRARHPILVFDRAGHFLRAWGEGFFTAPHACRVDPQGNLWITDTGDHRVMKFTPEGKLLATWGVKNRPGSDSRHFNQPSDVAFAPFGDIYIADGYGNARVVRLSPMGQYLGAWGKRGTRPGQFRLVHSIAVDAQGRAYVVDRANDRIQVFTPDGRFLAQWRHVGHPFGLFLTPDQRLFVSDGIANTITIYDLQGQRLAQFGGTGRRPGQMRRAHMLCVDTDGAVYVAEVNGKRIQKFLPVPAPHAKALAQ
ncbi:MAG TPA: peptidyl-alpha-hydroxyglycine alpha-amidating lyase family protein, partial [Chthonomonadaceae bacterium]|nr:peptidyl-alpha-hydroxyglycine alpha-amidating lyase family protein [Chthonomonadaceae bacterium]